MTKSELRKLFFEKRSELSADGIAEFSHDIAKRFFESFDFGAVKTIQCFISIEKFKEIETSHLLERLRRDFPQIRTVAPRIDCETGSMQNLVFNSDTEFAENKWGVPEPVGGEEVEPHEIDMVMVPLLCFDERGYRVGYGKGFYDRFLAECRPDCLKVGLSISPPVERIDDTDQYDVLLDHCLTPDNFYTFQH